MKPFDRDKYLRNLELQKLYHQYKKYAYIGIPCIVCIILGLHFTYSKFTTTSEDEVIRTTVGNFIFGDVVIGAYIDGEYSKEIPSKNDGYIVSKIVCDNNADGEWNYDNWSLVTKNLTTRSKCNIYFEKNRVNEIISKLDTTGKCPTINEDKTVNVTKIEKTSGYLCSAPDAYGTSYYFRGDVANNYVKFANLYWRIIRINGDETIRMIYDGTKAHANGEVSEDRILGTSVFNNKINDNAYVGYMYGISSSISYSETHQNINSSDIKNYLDIWYEQNIKNTNYEKYLVNNLFCSDREISKFASLTPGGTTFWTNEGYGNYPTLYRWGWGPWKDGNVLKIRLACSNKNDSFTVNNLTYGNGSLKYPIALINTDEVVLAGGWNSANENYYLYTGNYYWTMTPGHYAENTSHVHIVFNNGFINNNIGDTNILRGVKPVINVNASILHHGTGTSTDPYRLED